MTWIQRIAKLYREDRKQRKLFAAWSEETKQRIILEQGLKGGALVEHEVTNLFDLSLWKYDFEIDGLQVYSVAFNAEEHDPFSKEIVNSKIPADKVKGYKALLESVAIVLSNWIDKYQRLSIGSSNLRKFKTYLKILKEPLEIRGIRFRPMFSKKPDLGYFIYKN